MTNAKKFIKAKNQVTAIIWAANVHNVTLSELLSEPGYNANWEQAQKEFCELQKIFPHLRDKLCMAASSIWGDLDQEILDKI